MSKEINFELLDAGVAKLGKEEMIEMNKFLSFLADAIEENQKLAEICEAQSELLSIKERTILDLRKRVGDV